MADPSPPPRILSIAGSDSSGGAGIQADIKTIERLGGYAMTAITAVTAQNTLGVTRIAAMEPSLVRAQIEACLEDLGVDAIKIGMLGSPAIAAAVLEALDQAGVPIVLDPVMVATSGSVLADDATLAALAPLMDRAALVTPNLPELAALTGTPVDSAEAVHRAARTLADRHGAPVLAKGGHGDAPADDQRVIDRLVYPGGDFVSFDHARLDTRHTHGTGCTLSSAIATLLGHGQELEHAVRLARGFVLEAIAAAPGFGGGSGPLGHSRIGKVARVDPETSSG